MIRKILKWTGIIVSAILVLLTVVIALRQNRKFDAPYPQLHASKDSAVIARGKELVFGAANCDVCHSTANVDSLLALGQEPPLSGGAPFVLPFGVLYPKNLSTHPTYGIGRLTDQEIARVLRYNVNADGTAVLMPGHNFTDEDLTAVISYLRSQKPIERQAPKHKVNIMGMVVKAFFVKPESVDKKIPAPMKPDTTAAWGEYLATSVSDCKGCHTQGDLFSKTGTPFAGGSPFEDEGVPPLTPPNLTQHPSGRIYGWTQQDFINRFRQGKKISYSHMPWESFKRMSDNDLKAIYNFLKSLKPAPTPPAEKK